MYICIYVYISPNSFPGRQKSQKIPWVAAMFRDASRAKLPKAAKKCNTIEDRRSQVPEVTCFTVNFVVPTGPAGKRQHYRGSRHLPLQMTRGAAVFFAEALGSRAVALPIPASAGIYGGSERQCLSLAGNYR